MLASSLPPSAEARADALLQHLLDASETGIAQLRPVYAADQPEEVLDFAYLRLNPAAQRLLGLPEHPTGTLRSLEPQATFAFYQGTFLSGQPGQTQLSGTTVAGHPYTLQVAAQRHGSRLVVSFTAVPAAELEVAVEVPAGQVFQQVFVQTPAAIALLHGPEHQFDYVNPAFARLFPGRSLVGHTAREVLPEMLPQGVVAHFDQVYRTGQPYAGIEVPLAITQPAGQPPRRHYFNFIYQAHPEGECPARISVFANDVTEQVVGRQQRENQRAEWQHLLGQAPVAIAVLRGPTHTIELANAAMCQLWQQPLSHLLGKPFFEAIPEADNLPTRQQLANVLATGVSATAYEVPLRPGRSGEPELLHLNFICQSLREADGKMTGIVLVITNASEQVQNRQHVQQLNEELRIVNEQLRAANEELRLNNQELAQAQQRLGQLNQELECRVAQGVQAAQQAHAAAELQRRRLASFLQQAPAAICALDGPELVVELANPGFQRFFSGRALLGKPVREAIPELLDQPIYQRLREVYETGVTYEGQETLVYLMPLGAEQPEQRYLDCIYHARHNEQGRTDGVLIFAFDVTDRVLAQQRLAALQAEAQAAAERRAQERETFYQIFEHTPAIVTLMWGPEHRFAYTNRAFDRLFPGHDTHNRPLIEALPETVSQNFIQLLDHVYQTGESHVANEVPLTILEPDGQSSKKLYLQLAYQPYRENGQTLGVSTFSYDVTEQVLARREHEATQALLRTVFEQAPVALALLQGPTYVVAMANPAICELWDRDLALVPGRPLFELLPEVAEQGLREIMNEVRRTGTPFVAQERKIELLRQGRLATAYLNVVCQPLADAEGEFSSMVLVVTDVTPSVLNRRRADQAFEDLRETNEQLTRTNNDLDTFIYTASHDLKSPIANIEGLLLLLRQQLPAEARQAGMVPRVLDMMQGSIERFQLTIAQLTDLAKLQHAHTQPAEQVNLPGLVEAVRLDLAPLLAEAHAQLEISLDSCSTVSFAPQHLRSIVYNLLSNAIKYRHPDRQLRVQLRCFRADATTALEVQDNGLGLTTEQQSKLFGMFRRLHDHVPGSGVGLYMVKRIVENAGGSIQVHSQPAVGSTFTIVLPN